MDLWQRIKTNLLTWLGGEQKFTPASDVNWTRIETLVHGPGASGMDHGDADTNSAVFACLMVIALSFPEPPIRAYRKRAGREYPIPESPLQALLDRPTPNGELSLEDLLFWSAWALHVDGNAYWLKVRSGNAETGNVVELWPVSPAVMWPVTERDQRGRPKAWISYYRMQTGPGTNDFERVPIENVLHFRLGLDDNDMRKGLSPLKRLIRQISTDEEASLYVNALLRNFGAPGLVFSPPEGTELDTPQINQIKAQFREKFSGERRGDVAVLATDAKLEQFGFNPQQMDMAVHHRIPETRISAVLGVPAILAGLGAGLDAATYSNARELREFFTETKMVPLWRSVESRLNASLKPDFTSDRNVSIRFDLSDVRALQEDEDKKYTRLNIGVQGKWIKRNEARADVGLDPVEGWDEEDERPTPLPTPLPMPPVNQPAPPEEPKAAGRIETKVSRAQLTRIIDEKRRIRANVAGKAEGAIDAWFDKLADKVIDAAAKIDGQVKTVEEIELRQHYPGGVVHALPNGHTKQVKAITPGQWAKLVEKIFQQESLGLENILKRYTLEVITLTWPFMNLELQSDAQFNENDPLVQKALDAAGLRIPDITETTRIALTDFLKDAYEAGQPIEEIAAGVRGLVEETYSNRGRAVARTEIGRGQNEATNDRFAAAGVKNVLVFDNGFDNSHPFCRQVDGKVVSLEWSRRNSLQHPNCVRAFGAVFNYTGDVFTEEVPWS